MANGEVKLEIPNFKEKAQEALEGISFRSEKERHEAELEFARDLKLDFLVATVAQDHRIVMQDHQFIERMKNEWGNPIRIAAKIVIAIIATLCVAFSGAWADRIVNGNYRQPAAQNESVTSPKH